MFTAWDIFIILYFLGIIHSDAKNCNFVLRNSGKAVDLDRMLGKWYEYRTYHPANQFRNRNYYRNKIIDHKKIGTFDDSDVDVATQLIFWTDAYWNGTVCGGVHHVGNFTADGSRSMLTFQADSKIPTNNHFRTVSTDYDTFELIAHLTGPNATWNSNTSIFINIRKNPSDLTDKDRHRLEDTIDFVLKPFCLATKNFIMSPFDKNLTEECHPTRSQLLTDETRRLTLKLNYPIVRPTPAGGIG